MLTSMFSKRPAGLFVSCLLVLAAWLGALAPAAADDFLPPEKAFRFSARAVAPDAIEFAWQIAPGYYMYREQFRFVADAGVALGDPQLPPGKVKFDQTFGKDVETYRERIAVRVGIPAGSGFAVTATGQGCADAGLCYPPTDHKVRVSAAAGPGELPRVDDGRGFDWSALAGSDDVGLAGMLEDSGLARIALVFFGLGILLSLTPCVLPMVPILSAIVVGDAAAARRPRLRGLGLAAIYVLGMSVVYTAAGLLAGLSGVSLAASLQTPWVLGLFAALLAVLALAMFDVFTVQMPAGWQSSLSARAARLPGGRATGALAMGAVSALIVGPCVAAPLAGALLYVSQTRDVVLGGVALFALAWGMGVPLLAAGASAGALLPKAGPWMNGVKRFFGMLLLAVAWWMLWPVLPGNVQMAGWAVLAILAAALLHAFDGLPVDAGTGRRLLKGVGVVLALAGALEAVGAASGGREPLRPLAHLAAPGSAPRAASGDGAADGFVPEPREPAGVESPDDGLWQPPGAGMSRQGGEVGFERIRSVAELDALVAASDRPVMLDFYADWCVSCKEMEALTFPRPEVAARMSRLRVVQADVTANNADDRELLKRFRLFGPPGIVFFAPGGKPLPQRVIGYQNAERFARTLDAVLDGAGG
ncbi:Thiol:disulfide interchange protein DsbD precursor [Pigmentiphaga humi]|uniref:Thiol:disulfide interchange protein DsbD n=1 Tax=Pigmentiphaga humi TaxID=2478468 RepID=A0A3P4AYN9_9BURK|nr:protein-disulfide reductase DsbD [Pigmentiphaga humi]VCU69194.1 Thiol:disulfide interchange protein DsbD precursor [Pigmentiphaga humi]